MESDCIRFIDHCLPFYFSCQFNNVEKYTYSSIRGKALYMNITFSQNIPYKQVLGTTCMSICYQEKDYDVTLTKIPKPLATL